MLKFLTHLWDNFKEYIILVVLLVISLLLIPLNQKPEIKNVRSVAFGTFAAVTSVITNVISTSSLKNENERLRKTNADLMFQVNMLRKYGVENKELKSLLDFKDQLNSL